MKVVIVGAHGQIARTLGRLLSARGDDVVGVIRNPDHAADLEADGVEPAIIDLEAEFAENDLTHAVRGADAVVFAAGAGPNSGAARKETVDFGGAVHSVTAAARAEVRRFVIISAMGTDDPPQGDDVFSVYLRAKSRADDHVRGSDLDFTVVRPGGLTDEPATGLIRAARTVERGQIPRDDVAAVVVAVLDDDATIGRTFEVTSGLAQVADEIAGLADQPATLV